MKRRRLWRWLERAFRRIALPRFVVAPTGDRVVGAYRAGVSVTGSDGLELDWRCVDFPEEVVAPQVMVSSLPIAQVWCPPAAMVLNEPVGALVCPFQLEPQQLIMPFGRKPHEWSLPAVTALKNLWGRRSARCYWNPSS